MQNLLGGKTGTAEVYGKQAPMAVSWGPTSVQHGSVHARFVITGMVEQGRAPAPPTSAGPYVKRIWDGRFGLRDSPRAPRLEAGDDAPALDSAGSGIRGRIRRGPTAKVDRSRRRPSYRRSLPCPGRRDDPADP